MKQKTLMILITALALPAFAQDAGSVSVKFTSSSSQVTPIPVLPPSSGGGGGSGGPINLPMITSRSALRSYAAQQVSRVFGSTYSQSLVSDSGETYFSFAIAERPVDLTRIKEQVMSHELEPAVANPNDYVSFYLAYQSSDGDNLFQGGNSTKFRLDPLTGRWMLPSILGFEINVNYEIPLVVSNVYHARLLLKNADGSSSQTVSLRVDERTGKIYYQTYYAGAPGVLILERDNRDGTGPFTTIIDNGTGKAMQSTLGKIALAPEIRDFPEVVVKPGDSKVLVEVESYSGYGESPTVQLTVTNPTDGRPIPFIIVAKTTEGEVSEQVCIRRLGTETTTILNWECYPAVSPNGEYTIQVRAPGIYHVIFGWRNFRPFPVSPPMPVVAEPKGGG